VIDISSEVEPGLPPLWGIVSEIREALLNIILNSVDAMPKGGKIVLSASSSGFHIVIEVRDTGHGMNAEQKQRCLEPFYTTKGAKGTGLGLAAVYGMMQRHGGSIEIDSKVQQGTTIRLLFPIRETDLQHPVPVKPDYKNNTQAERVLYVDDDTVVLDALTHIMTAQGFNVTPVTSAEQALGAFESGLSENQPFDVVVTDLSMPHMSGREIAAKIKKRTPSTPVILLSGWGELASGADEDDPNVDRSFGKPPNIVELARTIGELTAGSP